MFLSKKLNKGGGSATPDAQFNYVTMLLHGDGTNGAQNNTFLDSSTNNFTITRNGNTTQGSFSPYGSNWSNYFDGSGDYLTVADNTALDLGSSNFTLECWLYSTVGTSNECVINKGYNNSQSYLIFLDANTAGFFGSSNGSTFDICSNASIGSVPKNTWTHLAVCRSGSSIRLFNNGALITTVTSSASFSNSADNFIIGSTVAGSFYYNGYLSNVRLVKGTALYTSAFTPSTTPLTAITNTSLLTCQSNRFIDNSANNFTVTATGNTSVQRFNPFGASTAYSTSVIGGSGYFDNSGDYLDAPTNNAAFQFGTGDFTVECWVYQNATNSYPTVLEIDNHVSNGGILFYVGTTTGDVGAYSSPVGFLGTATAPPLNTWNHIAWVRSSGTFKIYVNGVGNAGVSFTTNLNISATVTVNTNRTSGFYNLVGNISNLRLVKGTAVYTSNFTPSTAPLTVISGTSLLLPMTNGAIFDNAMMNDLETVGNAQISTSVVKYGTGSLAFDGSGDYLVSNAASSDLYAFGTGDFTVEFWLYLNSTSSVQVFYDSRPASAQGLQPTIYINSSGTLFYYTNVANRITGSSLSANTWYHIAVARSGTSTKMFVNGTQVGSTYTDSTNYVNPALRPMIGADGFNSGTPGGNPMNGYIDDLRVTKGYARYTTTFTPPTAAFPNTGPV